MFQAPFEQNQQSPLKHGPFVSVRSLKGVHGCDRVIMLHERQRTNHLLYRFGHIQDVIARRRVFDRFMRTARLAHPHILTVQHVSYDSTGRLCVITDYPGNQDGLVTLEDLLVTRGGTLGFSESVRLVEQLLHTSAHAEESGVLHGPFRSDELLVDRHGCTLVELFGLDHALHDSPDKVGVRAEQIRSIAEIGSRIITGVEHDTPSIRVSQFGKKSDKAWDDWFRYALDPVEGFEAFDDAIASLPGAAERGAPSLELKPQPRRSQSKRFSLPKFRFVNPSRDRES